MNRNRAIAASAAICFFFAACAGQSKAGASSTTPAPAVRNLSLITADELVGPAGQGNALDAIRQLRASWDTGRGATSVAGGGATHASIDGGSLQTLDVLENLPAASIKEMRLLSASDASQRFGHDSRGGKVILVTRK